MVTPEIDQISEHNKHGEVAQQYAPRAGWSILNAAKTHTQQRPVARYCREGDDLVAVYANGEELRIKGYFLEKGDELPVLAGLPEDWVRAGNAAQSGEAAYEASSALGRLEEMFGGQEEGVGGAGTAANSGQNTGDSASASSLAIIGPLALLAMVAADGGGNSEGSSPALAQPTGQQEPRLDTASKLRTLLTNFESATEADFQAAGVTGVTSAALPTVRVILGALEQSEREAMTLGHAQEIVNIASLVHTEYNTHRITFIAPSEVGIARASFDDPNLADGERTLTLDIPLLSERYSDRIVEIDMDDEFRRVEVRIDSDSDDNWDKFEEYSYNEAGMVTRLVEKLDNYDTGTINWIWESQYDSQGRLHIYTTDTGADGDLDWRDEHFYNEADQVIRIEYDRGGDGAVDRSARFQYDEEGRESRRETDFLHDGTVDVVHIFFYDEDSRLVYTLADTGVDGDKSGDTDQDGTMDYLDFVDRQVYEFAPTVEEAEAIGVIDKAINMALRGSTTLVLTDEVLSVFTGDNSRNFIEVEGGSGHTIRLSGGIAATGEVSSDGYVEYQGTAGSLFVDPRIVVEIV